MRIPIGANDRHGTPIHLGDRLRFDEKEWGGPHEFVVEIEDGELTCPGKGDLSSWCEIISPAPTNHTITAAAMLVEIDEGAVPFTRIELPDGRYYHVFEDGRVMVGLKGSSSASYFTHEQLTGRPSRETPTQT